MSNLFNRVFGREKKSAQQAKERLELVLNYDRAALNPGKIDLLKDELIEVISHYIDIDPSAVQIKMAQDGRQQRLIAEIPIKTSERRRRR